MMTDGTDARERAEYLDRLRRERSQRFHGLDRDAQHNLQRLAQALAVCEQDGQRDGETDDQWRARRFREFGHLEAAVMFVLQDFGVREMFPPEEGEGQ